MADIGGRNDAVRHGHVQREYLSRKEDIAVQCARGRGGRASVACLSPQVTPESERGIREGQVASWHGVAEGLHTRQAYGVVHPLQLATDFVIRDCRHEDKGALAETTRHPRATSLCIGYTPPLCNDPEGPCVQEDHAAHG